MTQIAVQQFCLEALPWAWGVVSVFLILTGLSGYLGEESENAESVLFVGCTLLLIEVIVLLIQWYRYLPVGG